MRTTPLRIMLVSLGGAAFATALSIWASQATAVATRSFLLDDAGSLAAGELDGTAVLSTGAVVAGVELRRLPVDDVPIAWSMATARDGAVYIGTGNEGKIYRLRGDNLEMFAETGQLLVSALAVADDGTLFAGTLPEGRIYSVTPQGQVAELARPDGAEHVWSLVWDSTRSRLFAATGPEGKVFAIDRQGHSDVFWDSNASHVMALDVDSDGAVYAGTDSDAVVVRLRAPGRAEVVYDFAGNEITSLDARDGALAVAANEFPDPPAATATKTKTAARASRPAAGKGKIWRVTAEGRAQQMLAADDTHFTCVELAADGTIYAGTGKEGRIHRINPDASSATWIDVDERQVLAIDLDSQSPAFVTGDAAAIYRVVGSPARNALWTSKALDAQFVSRFGLLTWRGTGAVQFQTRSGNRAEPDESWSEWSQASAAPSPIRSPAARFLQIRARLPEGNADAAIFAVTAYYLPQNQRAQLSDVSIEPANATKTKEGASPDRVREPTPRYKLKWKVENPDADDMRYRLRYRAESQTIWRDMFRESEELTTNEYTWDTAALPDGWYLVEVRGTDAPANPDGLALEAVVQSEPLLIDNHPPRLDGLRGAGTRVSGRALDDLGPIARLEYAVDGGDWHVFFSTDDLLDSGDERFDVDVGALPAGSHIVAVRVTDSGGNTVTDEVTIATR